MRWKISKMAIDSITDENYSDFKKSSRAVLMVSTSTCQKCKEFLPVLETISRQSPQIKFGKTLLDKDRSIQLKKEYPDIARWILPTTLFFKKSSEAGRISGGLLYSQTFSKIQESLIFGTIVYVLNGSEIYVPATIKQINGRNGPYTLQLLEKSSLGQEGSIVQRDESKIKWNLESRV